MRIAIVTDAWTPQVNGVVTTLHRTVGALEHAAHVVRVLSPDAFRTIPCPTYPEIRLALWPRAKLAAALDEFAPDAVHIATEGPLGAAARRYCAAAGLAFTTSYHTQFPQYLRRRAPIPEAWSYAYLRRHHGAARRTLVATEHMRRDLLDHGFANVVIWSRGVDAELSSRAAATRSPPRGRFGSMRAGSRSRRISRRSSGWTCRAPRSWSATARARGARAPLPRRALRGLPIRHRSRGAAIGRRRVRIPEPHRHFRARDARGNGLRHAGRRVSVTGPIDVVTPGVDGVLHDDLRAAALAALTLDRGACRRTGLGRTWERASAQFLWHLVRARGGADLLAPEKPTLVHRGPKRPETVPISRPQVRRAAKHRIFRLARRLLIETRAGSVAPATQIAPPLISPLRGRFCPLPFLP